MKASITIVAISGSLRSSSANTRLLHIMGKMMPANIHYILHEGIGSLPHFNTEIDVEPADNNVLQLRNLLKQANGVIICTPEYAFGVPGSLKNALDWMVSSGELNEKPVAAISASLGGDKALAALLLTLQALGTKVAEDTSLNIPFINSKFNADGSVIEEVSEELEKLVGLFLNEVTKVSSEW